LAKILITTIQVKLVLIPGMGQHKLAWIVFIKIFTINLQCIPSQSFPGHPLWFHNFFTLANLNRARLSLFCFFFQQFLTYFSQYFAHNLAIFSIINHLFPVYLRLLSMHDCSFRVIHSIVMSSIRIFDLLDVFLWAYVTGLVKISHVVDYFSNVCYSLLFTPIWYYHTIFRDCA